MVIYIDLVFIMNFILDLLLVATVNIVLKRYAKIFRLIASALFGSISLISLVINFPKIVFMIVKLIMAIIMCLIAYGYKNIKYTFYNVLYLYMTSIILGGFLYYLKLESSIKNDDLVFYYHGLAINYYYLLLLAPLILVVFIKSLKVFKEVRNYYYNVRIVFNNDYNITLLAFLDTGNRLKDPVTNKPIILLNRKVIEGKVNIRSPMYVPYNSLNNHGLLECIKPRKVFINKTRLKNYLIGLSNQDFKLNGVDCILNYQIMEDIND